MLAETYVMDNEWSTGHYCKINTKGVVRFYAHEMPTDTRTSRNMTSHILASLKKYTYNASKI